MLVLSTRCAPDLGPDELLEICIRKGFLGVELAQEPGGESLLESAPRWADAARSAGVALAALRPARTDDAFSPAMAELSSQLDVPVLAPRCNPDALVRAAAEYAVAGGRLLGVVAHVPEWAAALAEHAAEGALGIAWELMPGENAGLIADGILPLVRPSLSYVRLLGGGPEVLEPSSAGSGELMMRLALARYSGPIALSPSAPRYASTWVRWLGRRAGSGCGSRAAAIPILKT